MSYTREEIRAKFEQAFETDKREPQSGEQGIDLEKAVDLVVGLFETHDKEGNASERRWLAAYRGLEKTTKVLQEQRDAAVRNSKDLEEKYEALQLSHDDLESRYSVAVNFNSEYMRQRKNALTKLEDAQAALQADVTIDLKEPVG